MKGVLNVDMFDDCSVPDGLDMARVRGAIVMRCGLLTPLFNEPMTQRNATQQFFFENQWNFEQLLKVIEAEYNPVENVFEDSHETVKRDNKHDHVTTHGKETENKISAENVSYYSPDSTVVEGGTTGTEITEDDTQETTTSRHGNIGVTSAQKLINESLDLIDRLNPYRFIADLYEKELIIGLY